MPLSNPLCSVYACHDAATFMLLDNDDLVVLHPVPVDALCVEHWLQLRVFDPDRAYQFISIRYAGACEDEAAVPPAT